MTDYNIHFPQVFFKRVFIYFQSTAFYFFYALTDNFCLLISDIGRILPMTVDILSAAWYNEYNIDSESDYNDEQKFYGNA